MTSRDWDKELAKIDRQLASLSDEALAKQALAAKASADPSSAGSASAAPIGMPRGAGATAGRSAAGLSAAPTGRAAWWGAYAKVSLATTGAVGLWVWPWAARCGAPLAGLVAAAAVVLLLSLWSARGTWTHRLGVGHVVSLLALLSALVLGAREVLPRVGYAKPTPDRPDQWRCEVAPPSGDLPASAPRAPRPGTTEPSAASSL
jgi:hypothetical protein